MVGEPEHNGVSEQDVLKGRMKRSWGLMRSLLSQLLIVKSQILGADPVDNMHPLVFSHILSLLLCNCLYKLKLNP